MNRLFLAGLLVLAGCAEFYDDKKSEFIDDFKTAHNTMINLGHGNYAEFKTQYGMTWDVTNSTPILISVNGIPFDYDYEKQEK